MCQTSLQGAPGPQEALKEQERALKDLPMPPAGFSGLKGKALVLGKDDYPTKGEVIRAIPKHCFEINTATSFKYLLMSKVLLFGMGILAHAFIPVKLAFLPLWFAYAVSLNLLAVAVDAMTAVSRSTLVGTDVFVIRKPPVEFGAPFH